MFNSKKSMRSNPIIVILVLLITGFSSVLNAQSVQGLIYTNANDPVSGVFVFYNSEKIAETNTHGIFFLPEGFKLPMKLVLEHPQFFISEVEMRYNNSTFHLLPLSKSEKLDEIIVSSNYKMRYSKETATELIIPTDRLTAKNFDTYSPIDLVSAINETPGVFMQSGALNTNRIVIRGVGSRTLYGTNKIRAYFNGIPITNGVGETQIDIFDPEDLQSLEIIKGPKATQYGANLGGTLLLNTMNAVVGETHFKSSLSIGSFGMIKNTIAASTSTEKFSVNLNYDYLQTNGFRENNNYDRKTLLLTSAYKFNSKNEVSVLINYVDYFAQIPSSIGKTAFDENPSQAAITWKEAQGFEDNKQILTGLNFMHHFSDSFTNASSVFYTYLDHYEPRPFNILDEFTNGYGARTVFIKNFPLMKNSANLSFGGEFYKDFYNWKTIENIYKENNGNGSLEGQLLSDNREKRDNLNVFTTLTIPFTDKFKGQFGLNFNNTKYRFDDLYNQGIAIAITSAVRNFEPIVATNVNLLYQFNKNFNSYFNFSRGFNYPSIDETLTSDGIINNELGPEKGYNYEIGSELFLLKGKLCFRLNAYILDIDDLLVAERVGDDQYIGRNAGKTQHKGVEVSISFTQPINRFLFISPYLNAELTDHKFIDFVDGDNNFSGNQLTGVPNKKVNGGIHIGFNSFILNTNFLHIGAIPLNDSNLIYSEKYTVFNTKLSYKKELFTKLSLEVNVGINNFTDEKYAASVLINATGFGNSEPRYYYPGMPKNWFGGVKLMYRI